MAKKKIDFFPKPEMVRHTDPAEQIAYLRKVWAPDFRKDRLNEWLSESIETAKRIAEEGLHDETIQNYSTSQRWNDARSLLAACVAVTQALDTGDAAAAAESGILAGQAFDRLGLRRHERLATEGRNIVEGRRKPRRKDALTPVIEATYNFLLSRLRRRPTASEVLRSLTELDTDSVVKSADETEGIDWVDHSDKHRNLTFASFRNRLTRIRQNPA